MFERMQGVEARGKMVAFASEGASCGLGACSTDYAQVSSVRCKEQALRVSLMSAVWLV